MKQPIVRWLRQEVKSAKAKGIVLGLSGGVDSSVVAALAVLAVGRKNVLALFLPCHSCSSDYRDALVIAKQLGISLRKVDLNSAYKCLLKFLPGAGKLACANIKPRLRMTVLYYFANKYNYLVCGTGNKSEIMAGYFTKYGDGACDLLPLAGLYKHQVRKLAGELGISKRIITKPPSAGLWPGQTDEGEMGISYDELDDILERIEKHKKQIAAKTKVNKVKQMLSDSEHKRRGPKICTK